MPNTPNDHIPRIAALPAAPVDSTPAPQPALDVDALVAEAERCATDETTGCRKGSHTAFLLARLAAALKQERERAERAQKQQDFLAEQLRQQLGACREQLLVLANENDSLQSERDTLAARLAEVEREREVLRMVVSRCCDAMESGASCMPTASLEFMQLVPDEIYRYCKGQRDSLRAALTQRDAAERALADAQATLAGLGEVEWEVQSEHDPYPFEPLKEKDRADAEQDERTIRAIRRVLGAGGAGNG